MIFQDPFASLHPMHRVGDQIAEAVLAHSNVSKHEAGKQAVALLRAVGIPQPDERARDFAHQFSGGMRQRAMIAMALVHRPSVLIADEPTTALDVTVQAQILELIERVKQEFDMGVILITHDLGVIAETADTVLVMYAGREMEYGPAREIFTAPQHPVHLGAPPFDAHDRRSSERAHRDRGHASVARVGAERLSLPSPLRVQLRPVPDGVARAASRWRAATSTAAISPHEIKREMGASSLAERLGAAR